MGMEDLSIDITYDHCYFSLDSTFKITVLTKKNTLLFWNVNFGTTGYTFKSKIFLLLFIFLLLYGYT